MQVLELSLEHYRSFSKVRFDFDPQLNLIIGPNGSGKSTLLGAIRTSLQNAMFQLAPGSRDIGILNTDAELDMQVVGRSVRYQRLFPVGIKVEGLIFGEKHEWSTTKSGEAVAYDGSHKLYSLVSRKLKELSGESSLALPLVCFYGPYRNIRTGSGSLGAAASEKPTRLTGYDSWNDALIGRTQLENWVIGKTLERLQLISDGVPASGLPDDELDLVNAAVKDCIPGALGLRYDLRFREMLFEKTNGEAKPFASLSDGQQSFLALIADVARRMCLLNPQLGKDVLSRTSGLLVIDELDLHLHPDWQRRILRWLKVIFPLLQIFATCHSPQMIGGLPPSQVMILESGAWSRPEYTYGQDANRLLEDVMGASSREPVIQCAIEIIFRALESSDVATAKKKLAELEESAPGLPEAAGIRALIRRHGAIGK